VLRRSNCIEAHKALGRHEIDATVLDLDELHRQLAEVDENLAGTKLTPAERALFTRRRKEIYEALHPETKHGGDRASRQLGDLKEADRFTADTAKATGQSERAIQRDAARGSIGDDCTLSHCRHSRHCPRRPSKTH
jgi:ParB-like chromosome segregation protein Spo0J